MDQGNRKERRGAKAKAKSCDQGNDFKAFKTYHTVPTTALTDIRPRAMLSR